MKLYLSVEHDQEIPSSFTNLFTEVNFAYVDSKRPIEAQVSQIEKRLGAPPVRSMLVYSEKLASLGTVLSRRYINAAKISDGPLKLGGLSLAPDHISCLPNQNRENRILFLAPHCDEAYIAAVLPHKLMGDDVFLHSFTHPSEQTNNIENAYALLGLDKDDYSLGSFKLNDLFKAKKAIEKTVLDLFEELEPTVVFSVHPGGANFDHISVAQVVRDVVLHQSEADLLYGYVIQSRNTNPVVFPLFPESTKKVILQAFGKQGFGKMFHDYLPFLERYMHTLSEPLLRLIGQGKLPNLYSLPLEAERLSNYIIPNPF